MGDPHGQGWRADCRQRSRSLRGREMKLPAYHRLISRSPRHCLFVTGFLCACFLPTVKAQASVLAVGWSAEDSPVYKLEVPDGAVSLLGYSGFRGLNSLARGPEDQFYSVATYTDKSTLVSIDPLDGHGTQLASLDVVGVRGLASDASGNLYGALANGKIIQIDPATGLTTQIVQTPYVLIQGLAFSPSGSLYAWDGNAGLIGIDVAARTATDVNPAEGGLLGIQTIYFTGDGKLYGLRNYLYDINLDTGKATQLYLVGSFDLRGAEVIAPEPASLLLVSLASLRVLRRPRLASKHPIL